MSKKKGKFKVITQAHATKARIPPAVSRSDEKIPPSPGTNQIAGFVEFRPLTHCFYAVKNQFYFVKWLKPLNNFGKTAYLSLSTETVFPPSIFISPKWRSLMTLRRLLLTPMESDLFTTLSGRNMSKMINLAAGSPERTGPSCSKAHERSTPA